MNKVIEIIDSDDDSNTPPTNSNTPPTYNMETNDNQQSQSRRRRRKSVLHAMTDPDMQFQTISLEDDDDEVDTNSLNQAIHIQKNQVLHPPGIALAPRTVIKTTKIAPKILSSKAPTSEEIMESNLEKFITDPETVNDIYAIAEERARINYLLSINGMPEINFTLYTRPERLQFQFEERLKQRRMVNNWENTRMLESRRNLLQKNDEQKM